MKILVTYFSRSGYTKHLAEKLARMLDAQIAPIEEAGSRDGVMGYLRSVGEALRRRDATIRRPALDPGDFDLVLIGTPVWAAHPSSPARAFARLYAGRIKHAALFCTLGGSGGERALRELAGIVDQAPVATLALTDRELDSGSDGGKLERFAQTLRTQLAAA